MIFDRLNRLSIYRAISKPMATAIDFAITSGNNPDLPVGRIEIAGEDVFGIVHAYTTKPVEQCKWEAHRRYIDIQLMLAGTERMDVADLTAASAGTPFDVEKDFSFFDQVSKHQTLHVPAGAAAIFFPHDVHRPSVASGEPEAIRKLVLKVRVE